MKYWYIPGAGSLRASEQHPDDVAFEISASLYTYCVENFQIVSLDLKDGKLFLHVEQEAYRLHALATLQNGNYVSLGGVIVYDDELPFVGPGQFTRSGQQCMFTQEEHVKAVQDRNRKYALKLMLIRAAKTVEQIDSILVGKSDD